MSRVAADEDVGAAVGRTLAWFDGWHPATVVDFVLSAVGVKDVEGFETSGPRGLETPLANALVGSLAVDAGRPELARECLLRAAELYRERLALTNPPDEELTALVERLEASARG